MIIKTEEDDGDGHKEKRQEEKKRRDERQGEKPETFLSMLEVTGSHLPSSPANGEQWRGYVCSAKRDRDTSEQMRLSRSRRVSGRHKNYRESFLSVKYAPFYQQDSKTRVRSRTTPGGKVRNAEERRCEHGPTGSDGDLMPNGVATRPTFRAKVV